MVNPDDALPKIILTLDKVDALLQIIYSSNLPEPIKLLAMQLFVPFSKLCIREPAILESEKHPIHNLIAAILEGGQYWDPKGSRKEGSLYHAILNLVCTIHDHVDSNPNVIVESLIIFEHIMEEEKQKLKSNLSPSTVELLSMNEINEINESQEQRTTDGFIQSAGQSVEHASFSLVDEDHLDFNEQKQKPQFKSANPNNAVQSDEEINNQANQNQSDEINENVESLPRMFNSSIPSVLPQSRIKQISDDFEVKCEKLTKDVVIGVRIKYQSLEDEDDWGFYVCRDINAAQHYFFSDTKSNKVFEMTRNGLAMAIERGTVVILTD